MEKSYKKPHFKRYIPKAGASYKRYMEDEVDKSEETNMNKVDQEIEAMAEKMEKSTTDFSSEIRETIKLLGPEGLKKAMPSLSEEQAELLQHVLQDMRKAVEMDKEYAAKRKREDLKDTKFDTEFADDDQDEKLVKPEAAKQNHQGNPIEGWEGQIIKGESMSRDEKQSDKSLVMGKTYSNKPIYEEPEHEAHEDFGKHDHIQAANLHHEHFQKHLELGNEEKAKEHMESHGKHCKMALELQKCMEKSEKKDEEKEYSEKPKQAAMGIRGRDEEKMKNKLTKMKEEIEKSYKDAGLEYNDDLLKAMMKKKMEAEMAKDKLMEMEEKEHGTKDPKKLIEAEKKEHKIEKSSKEEGSAAAKQPEQDQLSDTDNNEKGKSRAKKEKVEALEPTDETEADQVKVGKESMRKSVIWGSPNAKLQTMTGGRNHHFNVNAFYDEAIKKSKETVESDEIESEFYKGRGPDLKQRKHKLSSIGEMEATPEYQAKRNKLYRDLSPKVGRGTGDFGRDRGVSSDTGAGVSVQGMKVRDAKAESNPAEKKNLLESAKNNAKHNLKELKQMPKRDLGKSDINDMIENKKDKSADNMRDEDDFKSQKMGKAVRKSFQDMDLIEALGLTEEEAKAILG